RAYQRTADDIVGKITITALDAEMLVADARPLRIQAVHPVTYEKTRFTPDYLASQTRYYLASQTRSAVGAKTFVKPPNIIVPPSGLFRTMQLREGEMGFFQVVDGIGGTVRCWDERIGRVFAPDEPLAHGGTMGVWQNPQRFVVRARARPYDDRGIQAIADNLVRRYGQSGGGHRSPQTVEGAVDCRKEVSHECQPVGLSRLRRAASSGDEYSKRTGGIQRQCRSGFVYTS